jgi:hypothetical protein
VDITLQAQILTLRSAVDSLLAPGRDTRQLPSPEARWSPGDRMSARVEAALPGGRFHVRVDDLMLEMQLPEGFQPGDRLELEFVSNQPRPSFLLLQTPTEPPPSEQVQLSASSRNLGEILKAVAPERASNSPTASTPLKEPAPLLESPTSDPARLAQALSGALGRSGLFYESHQAQWVVGQRPLNDLLSEPQGRLSPAAQTPDKSTAHHGTESLPRAPSAPMARDDVRSTDVPVTTPIKADGAAESQSAAPPVHPQTLPQVRSQLDALETHQLVWQGQLWPGQNLEWRIGEPMEQGGAGSDAQPWFTQLRLRLPKLGQLTADLALIGSTLRVRLTTTEVASRQTMDGGRSRLAESLGAAGIDLVSFKVADDGH